jgi:hypothetical protein
LFPVQVCKRSAGCAAETMRRPSNDGRDPKRRIAAALDDREHHRMAEGAVARGDMKGVTVHALLCIAMKLNDLADMKEEDDGEPGNVGQG